VNVFDVAKAFHNTDGRVGMLAQVVPPSALTIDFFAELNLHAQVEPMALIP
jgi:hypothetical protein